ncbi:hypothetical protein FIBSPDRAFT_918441 [Athelia psychrophila]|uniref:Copper homeostasis protein cutC homolog n=1 Tax=Athelia psychrophila TaxID=1759441 RepID=A0A166NR90_9AGAM|nr:hypothetical protein FIBSPDRAFT_918441 [Fibularhizoctonia sp. CBS 109695]
MSSKSCLVIEACVDSVESAAAAVRGGADRLELCGNLGVGGGTTPSMGLLRAVQKAVPGTPIMVMVRPRIGDFVYSDSEFDVMLEEIEFFKLTGVAGLVFGVLTPDGEIDILRTKRFVKQAAPLQLTFHRAVDLTANYSLALNTLASVKGITRILTSGQSPSITRLHDLPQVKHAIADHCKKYPEQTLLFGSGINPDTVETVLASLANYDLREIHLTGAHWEDGGMRHRPEGMGMGAPGHAWDVWSTSQHAIRAVRSHADIWVQRAGR